MKTTIKSNKWTETEITKYGEYKFEVEKVFEKIEKPGITPQVMETTYKNGQVWFSAMYPLNSEYAQKRIA